MGQGDELDGLERKAIMTGASKLYIEDLTDEMVDEVIVPSMMMGASYEGYLLGTAFARPVIAKRLVGDRQEGERRRHLPRLAPARATTRCGSSWPSSASPPR